MQERKKSMVKRKMSFIRMAVLAVPLVLLLLLSQTAFAQNTYVITDGDRVLVHTSSATDPAAVLTEAGLALGADDTYTTQAGIGVSEITVQRSQLVRIDNGGKLTLVNAKNDTVESLLAKEGILVGEGTIVSVPLEMEITEDMEIVITRTQRNQETYTATIPYEVIRYDDPTLPKGTELVVTKGQNGQLLCTSNVVYVDGQETERTVMEQTVVQQPVNQVVAMGTGNAPETSIYCLEGLEIGDDYIILPTGEVLTYTGTMQVKATAYTHTDEGCDMYTATGTTVHIGTVAVDPKLISYGTRMFIVANDGSYVYGTSTAEDCGKSIKGNRVDLYYPTYSECITFGIRDCTVYFLG